LAGVNTSTHRPAGSVSECEIKKTDSRHSVPGFSDSVKKTQSMTGSPIKTFRRSLQNTTNGKKQEVFDKFLDGMVDRGKRKRDEDKRKKS